MRNFKGKRYWLVGASEGLGRALAFALSQAGAHVIVSARNAERLTELVDALPGTAEAVACDVADPDSVAVAAGKIGQIDGMVYLAALYWPISATSWNTQQAEAMGEVGYVGALRVVGEVLPQMLKRDDGHIVLTGSLSGFRGLPGAIGYGSSKAAIMSLGETMRIDLKDTNITVQNANPGFIRTRLTDKNDFDMPFIMEPEQAAEHMMKLMGSNRFSFSFPRFFASWFRFSQFLPDWLYYRIY